MLKLPTASARSFAKVIRVQPITKKAISTKYTPNASINTTPVSMLKSFRPSDLVLKDFTSTFASLNIIDNTPVNQQDKVPFPVNFGIVNTSIDLPKWNPFASLEITQTEIKAPVEDNLQHTPLLALKRQYIPSKIRRKRGHGYLSRLATKSGRKVLNRRKTKGRRHAAL